MRCFEGTTIQTVIMRLPITPQRIIDDDTLNRRYVRMGHMTPKNDEIATEKSQAAMSGSSARTPQPAVRHVVRSFAEADRSESDHLRIAIRTAGKERTEKAGVIRTVNRKWGGKDMSYPT